MSLARRSFLASAAGLLGSACVPLDRSIAGRTSAQFRILERELGGRLGVVFYDPANRSLLDYRGLERFPMASTFKTSLAAFALALEQQGALDLSRRMEWSEEELLFHSPFTRENLGRGASLRELARAAQTTSDNLAANILLRETGGPAALTAFLRDLGDDTTRIERNEPEVNFVPSGEERGTTTPLAMARTLAALIGENTHGPLDAERRQELRGWMIQSETGLDRVRAGLPKDWVAGDKTGNSGTWNARMGFARGDVGFVESPAGSPVFFAVYHQSPLGAPVDGARVDAVFARIGRSLTDWVRDLYTIVLT
ncbi:class A beta-lactamase [Qipengyuania aurantiaca]|uniref:beta-lactamase n=1 Tax=Qipengyuania aurantiaca TaxID=2867233 RepID=A0ABX8ZNB8_9SPHN|nr:class A beta-lactamase [Qipengyuania aurantiaca]QZD90477.1 class A beta-lactamase [Qipengyuania aurantiaca]